MKKITAYGRNAARRTLAIAAAMLLTAGSLVPLQMLVNPRSHAALAEADLLECTPTSPYVYSLRSPDALVGGKRVNRVERINVATGSVDTLVDFSSGIASPANTITEQINGLGIRRDDQGRGRWFVFSSSNIGNTANSLQAPRPQDIRNVYQYDMLTGELTATRIPDQIWAADSNHTTRHGAIDLSTGIYYTATHRNNTDEFTLIAYDLVSGDVWLAGHLKTPDATGSSGDMAFDSLGNLFFVVGGQSSARQFTAPAGSLPTTVGQKVEITLTDTGGAATDEAGPQQSPPISRTNGVGVAFGLHGYLYETFASGFLYRVDPSTGEIVPDTSVRPQDDALVDLSPAQSGSSARGGSSTDLATCASPSTLEVRKFVNHRNKPADQFTISATRADGVEVAVPVTTTGTADGLQDKVFGPVGILALHEDGVTPWQQTITEIGTDGTNLAPYDTNYRCVDRNDPTWGPYEGEVSGNDERSFTIPTPPREGAGGSRAIVCTITNADPGNPIIHKTFDPDTPRAVVDQLQLTGSYRCEYHGTDPATVNKGTWSVQGAAPALITPDDGSSTDVPVGSVCQVWEDTLDDRQFPDDSWSWGTPAFDPQTPGDSSSATVTITSGDSPANTITVTNSARQATGPLYISKAFRGKTPNWLKHVEFAGAYHCAYAGLDGVPGTDDDIVNAGTWRVTGTGDADLDPAVSNIPVNSVCQVTESTPSDNDLPSDAWKWLTPSFEPATTDGAAGQITIRDEAEDRVIVTNDATSITGELNIVKAFSPGSPQWLNSINYTGSYHCVLNEETYAGTWHITGAGIAELTPSGVLPIGSRCQASEDPLDEDLLPDPSWSWRTPEVTPGLVTIKADETAQITLTNAVTQSPDPDPDPEPTPTPMPAPDPEPTPAPDSTPEQSQTSSTGSQPDPGPSTLSLTGVTTELAVMGLGAGSVLAGSVLVRQTKRRREQRR